MFARSSTFRGDPAGLDEAIDYVRTEGMATLEQVDGFVGLSMMVDRRSGECIATTSWQSEDAMRASSDRLTAVRGRFGGMMQAPAKVQEWQIAIMHRAEATSAGRWCRATWVRAEENNVGLSIELYRTALLPRIQELPGFCSASLLVDRARDDVCTTSSFDSLEALQRSRDDAWMIREVGISAAGVDIMDAAEYELAIAHLRVPELA